ncbi:MAG: coiled-coil domain-containing protein [Myxococcales bacterium]|jgi:chromosome segregation ATPase
MAETELPPTNLILQALHAIRKEVAGTNARLDQTNARLDQAIERIDQTNARIDETNERLERLRVFTVQKLTDLNAKVDHLGERVDSLGARVDLLGDRLENILTGQFGKDVRDLKARMLVVERRLGLPEAKEEEPVYGKPPADES